MANLYNLAREVAKQPIDWDNPEVARLQYEMRHDYSKDLDTFRLILGVVTELDDAVAWTMALTEIQAQSEQQIVRTGYPELDR